MNTEGKKGVNEDAQIFGLGNCADGVQGQSKHNFELIKSKDSNGNVKNGPFPSLCKYKYFSFSP